jgi:MinD superfamily P-loop ATPase
MKSILFLSGKGGTGKTSLAGAFAALAENKILADCDVDAANLHLLLDPQVRQTSIFFLTHR